MEQKFGEHFLSERKRAIAVFFAPRWKMRRKWRPARVLGKFSGKTQTHSLFFRVSLVTPRACRHPRGRPPSGRTRHFSSLGLALVEPQRCEGQAMMLMM